MPSKEHEVEGEEVPADRPREKHRRPKSDRTKSDRGERDSERDRERDRDRDRDPDRERDRDKDRDRERDPDRERDRERRHRSSRSHRSRHGEDGSELSKSSTKRHRRRPKDGDEYRERRERDRAASTSDLTADASRSSLPEKRVSMPYPSFSKAHSKEAVMSRDDLSPRKEDPLTPEPTNTDLDGDDSRRSKSAEIPRRSSTKKSSRPPSPPDTEMAPEKRSSLEDLLEAEEDRLRRTKSGASNSSRPDSPKVDDGSKVSSKSRASSQATYVKTPQQKTNDPVRSSSRASNLSRDTLKRSASSRSTRPKSELFEAESSPSSVQDSSPRTPTQGSRLSPHLYYDPRPESTLTPGIDEDPHSKTATPASVAGFGDAPPPPPPPPPPQVDIHDIPRVDYLLQNGGLQHPIPRQLSAVIPRLNGTRPTNPPLVGSETLFAPFFNLFDQYQTVLDKSGSLAVATGHRSVARRLLDRLENVFSRDLPAHGCSCVCCEQANEQHEGLTWGDCLEWVSGRIELPAWPPFDLAEMSTKAAEVSAEEPRRPDSPVNMDPDIAEEFREHYLRQTKKVKSAVDKWLSKTGDTPVPPPQEVDDETLTFAVLTSLEPEDRPYFSAILTGSRELKPSNRAPTPSIRQRNDFVIKCGLALQRLYRLPQAPRDAESACYLIKNRHTHDILVALANINNSEWEILTSGRFDGFLWSGIDESRGATPATDYGGSRAPSAFSHRGPSAMGSRTTTPFGPYSRGATPASFISLSSNTTSGRHAVSNDEEMEMAAIAEIEREIYTGMEALEDAFEKLHLRAEVIRNSLRQRGAGLMQNLQSRRKIDVYPAPDSGNSINSGYERPGWANEEGGGWDADMQSEWGGMDDFELMPDDSASNISSNRHRRPKRRTERRTPALIEEDEEER